MKLETAHKILIGSAIVFFVVLSLFALTKWRSGGGGGALLLSGGSLVAALAFTVYLRSFARTQKR
jgi:hypothetical protein